ncbi:tRNA wybutosine-synthesizing protein [Diplocarpon rosae]|nr:tRNA wybutosine-synthesizing protein [Diplocarpon rosae]
MTRPKNLVSGISSSERPPKPKATNPIEAAVGSWLKTLPVGLLESIELAAAQLLSITPKRWVVYPPMVLLPAGSLGPEWAFLGLENMSPHVETLWKLMLHHIGKKEGKAHLTHLAVNSGIPLQKTSAHRPEKSPNGEEEIDAENILRTPSGLIMLYGHFGPRLSPDQEPTETDFADAFWVSTKQNGIIQIWAPRYTMFSRGNVKEKARLLDFHKSGRSSETRRLSRACLESASAIDLYAGIGYFVFSYVKMGMKRVVGWELNPWSVEGLRRGAVANGWSVTIVKDGTDVDLRQDQIVVFLEDNAKAAERLQRPMASLGGLGEVKHVNCGLLPTSEMTWKTTLQIMKGDGWLHLHENVGVSNVPARSSEVEKIFEAWLRAAQDARVAEVEHVELVKTFAPGVWHCVFDVYVRRP